MAKLFVSTQRHKTQNHKAMQICYNYDILKAKSTFKNEIWNRFCNVKLKSKIRIILEMQKDLEI